jgi:hypothetical protein
LSYPPYMTCFSVCNLFSFQFPAYSLNFSPEICFVIQFCLQASSFIFLSVFYYILSRGTCNHLGCTCARIGLLTFLQNVGRGKMSIAVTWLILTWSREVPGWGFWGFQQKLVQILFRQPETSNFLKVTLYTA